MRLGYEQGDDRGWTKEDETRPGISNPVMTVEQATRIYEKTPDDDPTAKAYANCHRLRAATVAAAEQAGGLTVAAAFEQQVVAAYPARYGVLAVVV